MARPTVVIPAYAPSETLPSLVGKLTAAGTQVVVVDDGSGPGSAKLFDALRSNLRVTLLRHAVNLGKGAALRTGINHVLAYFPDCPGVVTADADGQHLVEDILLVSNTLEENPDHFVLGVRNFTASVPFRSRFGNVVTRTLVRGVVGRRFQDTQTGLRGIPATLCRNCFA